MSSEKKVSQTFLGLPDKNQLLDSLSKELPQVEQTPHLPFGYLQININEFSELNQAHGSSLGNFVLQEAGYNISRCLDKNAEFFHLGSDVFAVFQPRVASVDEVLFLANKILCSMNRVYSFSNEKFEINTRIGIVFGSGGFHKPETVLEAGRLACERADRNTSSYYVLPATVNKKDQKTLAGQSELTAALERQEFELYYQPIISMDNSRVLGFEALIRWNHPEMGMVLPGEFIPIAEKTGVIGSIGEWVLKTACQQTMFWQISGFSSLRLAVNFSSTQITQFKIIEQVENIIEELGFDPSLLEIELTEASALTNKEQTLYVMEKLNKLGVSFSIDDFGTGFSSLASLSELPLKHIKIDSSFVWDLDHEVDSRTLVKSMVNMANFLDINIIAEGVETESQKTFLKEQGVQNYQGNVYSKPLPVKKFTDLLMNSPS